MAKVSVIIPAYNAAKTIEECLKAVYNLDYPDFGVIVVDDCSTDNTAELVKKFPCQLLELEKNSGPAKTRNSGAQIAKGDILFFIDSDVIIDKRALAEALKTYQEEDVGAVIGRYSRQPANRGFFKEYMSLWKYYSYMMPQPPQYFTFFMAFCGSIKKKVFEELGGFDAKIREATVEDYEFGYRLSQKYKIRFNPEIKGRHYHPSFKSCLKKYCQRSSSWFDLFIQRKKFDTGVATASRGFGVIIAFLIIPVLLAAFFFPHFLFLALCLMLIFILVNFRFYLFTLKEKNLLFTLKSVAVNYLLAIAASLGVIKSVLNYLLRKWKLKNI